MIKQYTASVLALLWFSAHSTAAADARNGALLAKQWCSSCHLVERGQKGPTTEAAPFADIAKRPGFNGSKLAFFLLDPHPKMPNMQLTRNEAADIAAYIATLMK